MSYPDASVRERPDLADQQLSSFAAVPRHVRFSDRLAMRVGLWLLVRGAERARHRADSTAQADRLRLAREREAREFAAVRERLQWPL